MGILSRSLGFQALSLEDPAQPLLPPSALYESLGWGRSDAGVMVNEHQAMRISTQLTCVKVISEDLSANNHEIFQHMPNGSMRLATEHPYWSLLHDQPHPTMVAKVFWGALVACAVGWGNGYAWIQRTRGARVVSLSILAPGKTSKVSINGQAMYATTQTDTGQVAYLDPMNVLHIMNVTFDGNMGISNVRHCMNAYGLAAAAEKFGAQFFGNGARSTGVFSHPGQLDEEAYENIKKSIREMATGDSALRPIVLEEGMTWTPITIPPNEAQFLATRQFQRSEIAGMNRVPLHLIGDLQRATNNNIEHQSLDYIRYCLRPIAVGIEQEVNAKILGGPGSSFVMEHNFNDMMRGDFASQAAGIQIMRGNGIWSANDSLRFLRQNPIPADEGGDIRIVQGAMIPLSSLVRMEGEPVAPETTETDSDQGDTQPFNRNNTLGVVANNTMPQFRILFEGAVHAAIREGLEPASIKSALRPPVLALAQSVIATRFASATLTIRELDLVDAQISALTLTAATWTTKNAKQMAARIAEQVYKAFAGEVLQ